MRPANGIAGVHVGKPRALAVGILVPFVAERDEIPGPQHVHRVVQHAEVEGQAGDRCPMPPPPPKGCVGPCSAFRPRPRRVAT